MRVVSLAGKVDPNGRDGTPLLSPREARLVDGIAAGKTLADSATGAGISYRSARRYRLKPHVAEAIRNRIAENLAQCRAILSAGSSRAATALVAMADGTAAPDAARVSAAARVLESSLKLNETLELESRICALEAQGGHQHGR